MKIVLGFIFLLASNVAFACGKESYMVDYVLIVSMLLVGFCAISIPASGMLLSGLMTLPKLLALTIGVILGIFVSAGVAFWGNGYSSVWAVLIAALSMSVPSVMYFISALRIRQASKCRSINEVNS